MRPVVVGGSFWNTKFSVNGTHVVTLTNEGYSWVVLNAGTYEISTQLLKNEPLRIKIVLQPGRTHYVEVRESEAAGATSISYTRRDLLHEIPANTARPRLEKMKYTPASESTASASQ